MINRPVYGDNPRLFYALLTLCLIFPPALRILVNAVLGGKVAVSCNLQSALAGLNSFLRLFVCKVCLMHVVLTSGSCAMETHEPCQVRKEAALSGTFYVPRGCLDRANDMSNACVQQSKKGARLNLNDPNLSAACGQVFFCPECVAPGEMIREQDPFMV